jgi:hypothetical protein
MDWNSEAPVPRRALGHQSRSLERPHQRHLPVELAPIFQSPKHGKSMNRHSSDDQGLDEMMSQFALTGKPIRGR